MNKREHIPKRIRFEVLKRDSFTCQYCGSSAPNVVLHVDHISPVSKGGDSGILNLITSCELCNSGKGAIELSDDTALQKKKKQLERLQERREQIELMLEWQRELSALDNLIIEEICHLWESLFNSGINETGKSVLKKHLKKYSFEEINEAINIAYNQYAKNKKHEDIFGSIGGILYNKRIEKSDPEKAALKHIINIMKMKFGYVNYKKAHYYINTAHKIGASIDDLYSFARIAKTWKEFEQDIKKYIENEK